MKNKIYITILSIFFCFSMGAQQASENFYYYQGEKIFLQQKTDKMYLKFAPNVNKEQIRSIANSDTSLIVPATNLSGDHHPIHSAILKTKMGRQISSATIEYYKKRPEIVSATPLFQYNNSEQGLTDEFVVKLKKTTSNAQLLELAKQNDCQVKEENPFVKNQFMLSVSKVSNLNALQMSNLFYETGLFEFSEPNFVIFNAFNSIDSLFSQQYYLKNTGQNSGKSGIDINAEQAWTISTGFNVKIAVVDEGVDKTHPDLQTNLLPGYDPSGNNSGGAPVWDADNHGTACAGIIGAIQNNKIGISGVAPNCKMIPIHITDTNSLTGAVEVSQDCGAKGIDWAWKNGADVISNSWSCNSPYTPLTNAINNAVTQGRGGQGCVVVFASGNKIPYGAVTYPASLPNVISVGAIDKNGTVWNYSCRGDNLDVVAPSGNTGQTGDVVTTDRVGIAGYETGDYTTRFGGTSAACPQVAGVAGLILSQGLNRNFNLTTDDVRHILEITANKLGKADFTSETGYGLIDAYSALKLLDTPNQLYHGEAYGGTSTLLNSNLKWTLNTPFAGLAAGVYFVDKYQITAHVTFQNPFSDIPKVWFRDKDSYTMSFDNSNNGLPYAEITNITSTGFDVRYAAYCVKYDIISQAINRWIPETLSSIKMAYTAVGTPPCVTSFTSQTVANNTTVNGCNNFNVQNVTVTNNAKLTLSAPGDVTINGSFEVQLGSELETKTP